MADYETDAETPLDPAAERLRRKLVRLLLGSGIVMMLGLIAVFGAIVYKTGLLGTRAAPPHTRPAAPGGGPAGVPRQATIDVALGARLVSADLDGANALLTLRTAEGTTLLLLVDLGSGSVLGRYALRER